MNSIKQLTFLVFILYSLYSYSQHNYWQQHADYTMDIDVNAEKYTYKGTQKLIYTNNSPDTLKKVFYHLFYNAFQPNSEMDTRLKNIVDPDKRMVTENKESRIQSLKKSEIGYLNVLSLTQNGIPVRFKQEGTILQVFLNEKMPPGTKTVLEMTFEGQIPVMIRRAGRNNKNGVALSMAQWYPKLAEYDRDGWNAYPYIAREFHGVWGNFDVTIHIDKNYTVAGTGYLQNPQEIGHGYEDKSKPLKLPKGKKLHWHFVAPKVHDFTWAADPEYVHDIVMNGDIRLHFFYKNKAPYIKRWKYFQPLTVKAFNYFQEEIGAYPWKQYSVIQGGDGGMEYAMCTLVADKSNGSIGTIFHEVAHAWFQHLLATNEGKYPWMDEGFTEYISTLAFEKIMKNNDEITTEHYKSYFSLVKNGFYEPLTTHADRFNTNVSYSIASYVNGHIFLSQLTYLIGRENVKKALKIFYDRFKFKHPTPQDFRKIAEEVSDVQLGWYFNEWLETTHTIDYAVKEYKNNEITLQRIGRMPMPVEISVTYKDGSSENFYIPLRMMFGNKKTTGTILKNWAWTHPTYTFSVSKAVAKITIDPLGLMADVNQENNVLIVD